MVKRIVAMWLTAFPDFHYAIDEEAVAGPTIVQRLTATGTHRGAFRFIATGTLPPTGRSFTVQHIHLYTFRGGKIVEHSANRDDLGMLQQLGFIPAPPPAERDWLFTELGVVPFP